MKVELLVGADAFRERLWEDMASARTSVLLQTFSFEGDRVGVSLARALERSPAADRRLLVDAYTHLFHNDRLVPGPAWLERPFRREVLNTRRRVRRLRERGVGVRFCNPLWPGPARVLRRNHKKLALLDERVAYLGGINFCEHNFSWHDMMFRVEDEALGRVLARDFDASWEGRPEAFDMVVHPLRLISMNGRGNAARMEPILELIAGARESVDVVSAYVSYPFTRHLGQARRRGVRVRVITPERNNKPHLARHIIHAGDRHGLELYRLPGGMSHLKAMLVDGQTLVAGSTNFDAISYHIMDELVFITSDTRFVEAFRKQVWEPDLARSVPIRSRRSLGTLLGHATVRLGEAAAAKLAFHDPEDGEDG